MPIPTSSSVLAPEAKPAKGQTADDINDLFSELDKEPIPEKKAIKEKEEPEEETEVKKDTEESDDELELIEPEEEEEKLDLKETTDDLDVTAPPRKKEILKEFPELFKKFPFLEKMIYRDREYTQLFGSFDDAKEIADKAEVFSSFENQLLAGNTEQILKEVKETDEKAFNIIVDDYLTTLAKVDKDAYFHVVGNLNKRLIMEMIQEANDNGNDDLKQAALLVNQFVFGTAKFSAPTLRVEKKTDDAKDEVEAERLSFVKERFESSRDDLQVKVDNTLRATISDYIDPRSTMSPYVKKNAVADAMKYVQEAIAADPSVSKNLNSLWRAAFEDKFSQGRLDRIKSYYLSRAKANLKSAIIKARAEALKDSRPDSRTKETDVEEEENPRIQTRRLPPGKPSQTKGKNQIQKGESVTDYFMRD